MESSIVLREALIGVTLTGADESTDLDRLQRLLTAHPELEVGLLYSCTPEWRNRFPSTKWLRHAVSKLAGRYAVHICGRGAREELLDGELSWLVASASRVQVNGGIHPSELSSLAAKVSVLITQHTPANESLANDHLVHNHQLLVDGSGGRGHSPSQWRRPLTNKPVGFAGGLGPDNIASELDRIRQVARGRWWIDLEEKLRTNDWFDLDKCEAFIDLVKLDDTAVRATILAPLG